MQILWIRGKNIASLAQPFEVRLDQPPLSTAGLFAITGETGAGKSSLLDTLCLALYGNCPRLSGEGTRESVEEADGQELKSNDPRMALRRGAAEGYAEVAFIGTDGVGYAATWSARRARGRIDGRLQFVDRALRRLSDGQVLETQSSAVAQRIVALTGLTYDEFRRTVLLAQGDFDAFLSAKTADRAAILEKVTGTGIYRDISRRVFDRAGAARAALEALETRRAEHRLLTAEQRAELAAQAEALHRLDHAEAAERAAVEAALARWRAVAEADGHLAAAKARAETAERALADLTAERDWLARWDAARILRGEVRERIEAATALSQTRGALALLQEQAAVQAGAVTVANEAASVARAARDRAEDLFKSFAEDWSRATELDAMIQTATGEQTRAATDLTAAEDAAAKAQAQLDRTTARQTGLVAAIDAHLADFATQPGHEALLANWALVEERLGARVALSARITGAEAELACLTEGSEADRAALASLAARITASGAEAGAARAAQAAMAAERDGLRRADPALRLHRLAQAGLELRALDQARDAVARADQALALSRART